MLVVLRFFSRPYCLNVFNDQDRSNPEISVASYRDLLYQGLDIDIRKARMELIDFLRIFNTEWDRNGGFIRNMDDHGTVHNILSEFQKKT